jgi:acetyl esterase/lipase
MPSRHLVDPEMLPLTEMPSIGFEAVGIEQVRAMMADMRPALPATPADVQIYEAHAPGRDGAPDVRLVVTAPKAAGQGRPGILHIHGGGFVLGSADMTGPTDAEYASQLGAVVVSVDYRLAPETPHPGPVEDCYAGLAWLHAQAAALGVDPSRIVVTGESAGGGFAAALVLLAKHRGEYAVAFQHLVFPMLDDRTVTHPDPSPYLGQFVWTPDSNRFGWTSLLGGPPGGADVSAFAAPARASDLSALPPTFIICGALDLFLEEDLDYARRLIRAGVPTELHVYPGAPHGFMFMPTAQVTQTFARDSMAALARAVGCS